MNITSLKNFVRFGPSDLMDHILFRIAAVATVLIVLVMAG